MDNIIFFTGLKQRRLVGSFSHQTSLSSFDRFLRNPKAIVSFCLFSARRRLKMISWSGFKCFIWAYLLYLLSRRTGGGGDVEFFDSVTKVDHLKGLAELLEEGREVRPLIVAVTGSVASATPFKCQRSEMLAVILEETEEIQFLKRNWKFSWVQDTASISLPITKQVPWFLEDGTGRVNVSGAETALGFAFTVGSEVFEKPEPSSLLPGALAYLQGLKMLGVRRFEYVLPIGTWLTVVGEAVKDGSGNVRIQKPDQGPFYISPKPLDQLIPTLGTWSRIFKYASMGASFCFTVRGVIITSKPLIIYILHVIEDILFMFGYILWRMRQGLPILKKHVTLLKRGLGAVSKYILVRSRDFIERRRHRLLRNRVFCAAANRTRQATEEDVPDLCVICLDRKCDAVFLECGHMCCCLTCSLELQGKRCPLCRKPVVVLKIYRI
ncbi:E3 ubiquitin-protein ligase SPL1 [Brassica napus]|uniref:E3 ubiquitin-protein ligase SPL1 n=1 Tax=Brassica napus TaxID=3708 RepID=UPI002079150C|nr:E3 ubiquitin-protein ligase SPL1 [Brassica napus]